MNSRSLAYSGTMVLQEEMIVAALFFSLFGASVQRNDNGAMQSSAMSCGSSVDLLSTYTYPSSETLHSVVWHVGRQATEEPVNITNEPFYRNRTEYLTHSLTSSTLRIRDLREGDSREYRFWFFTHKNRFTGVPGIHLSVTGLEVKVSTDMVTEGQHVTLTCSTTCMLSPSPPYVWYRNGQPVTHRHHGRDKDFHLSSVSTEDSGHYSCAVQGHEQLTSPSVAIDVRCMHTISPQFTVSRANKTKQTHIFYLIFFTDSPKNTSAYICGEISEGSSVTLVCSSSANPPVNTYTWFRSTGAGSTRVGSGQNHSIPNVSSAHSGEYHCSAVNSVNEASSASLTLNVKYPPRSPKTVTSPSGEVVEGNSVTLTCSSEANPPVHTYTWYQRRGALSSEIGVGQNYSISNMTYGDSGAYYCQAENVKGSRNSTPIFVDVLYAPRNLSVSVSSFDGAITLICSCDANPPVKHYTWHKRTGTGTSQRATGRNLTLESAESGLYYCEAKNEVGAAESNSLPISEKNTAGIYAVVVIVVIAGLVIPSILLRKKRNGVTEVREGTTDSEQDCSSPVYVNVSRVAMTFDRKKDSEDAENDIHYTSVYFKHCDKQDMSLNSTLQKSMPPLQEEEVLYSTVKPHHASHEEVLYSTVK
ncbi:Fc receptor-like protein 5 isoform X2 [Alosa sapidissima]|uniref:Fc receptor-like protein 5 isoform X2 n=1 Tax=Alosa sapidissima TaxID=34773 RepID=UPI001C08DE2F|nr:Fc receptor-like protein 5 isoform X2 [Alosa sapidissima]